MAKRCIRRMTTADIVSDLFPVIWRLLWVDLLWRRSFDSATWDWCSDGLAERPSRLLLVRTAAVYYWRRGRHPRVAASGWQRCLQAQRDYTHCGTDCGLLSQRWYCNSDAGNRQKQQHGGFTAVPLQIIAAGWDIAALAETGLLAPLSPTVARW